MTIDRKHPVWAATYGAAFDRLLADELRFSQWPNAERLAAIGEDSKTVADAAADGIVHAPKPESTQHQTLALHSSSHWEDADVVEADGFGICKIETDDYDYVAIEDGGDQVASLYPQDLAAFMRRNYPLLVGPPEHEAAAEQSLMRELLSALSSKLGAGLGDESRSLAEYVRGIEAEIDSHLRVADERVSAHLRVADERIAAASRDSELLCAILEEYASSESDFDEHDSAIERAIENAIAERGKR